MGHQSDTFPPCLQKTLELKKLYIDFSFIGAVQGLVVQKPDKTNRGYVWWGTWVFFGWVCAARDFKLAPRSKKNFSLN